MVSRNVTQFASLDTLIAEFQLTNRVVVAFLTARFYARAMIRIVLVSLILVIGSAQAEIYRYTDPDGNVSFSNRPPAGSEAQPVELTPLNTVSPPPAIQKDTESSSGDQQQPYTSLSISEPQAEESIRDNAGNVTISVSLTPALRDSDNVHLYMDGNEMARGPYTSFHFQSIDRGRHEVHAEVKNKQGKSLIKSEPIAFYLLRVAVGGAP